MNELLYNFAVWLDTHELSTSLHESYYMYNWVESTHVLTLMLCLGMLFLIDLRMMELIMTWTVSLMKIILSIISRGD